MVRQLLDKIRIRLRTWRNGKGLMASGRLRPANQIPAGERRALLWLTSRRMDRHYYYLMKFLSENGYAVILPRDTLFLGAFLFSGKAIKKLDNLYVSGSPEGMVHNHSDLVFFDRTDPLPGSVAGKVHVRIDVANMKGGLHELVMPLPMSVEQYENGWDANLESYRRELRKFRIFYSGNLDSAYRGPRLSQNYGKISRLELVDLLKASLGSDEFLAINDARVLKGVGAEKYDPRFVLLDWFWNGGNSDLAARVNNEEWFSIVARADFFFACPGIVMPPTHAIAEAMAVGTIPITQSPEFFSPALQDGVNCLVFNTEAELIPTVRRALNMPAGEIEKLRRGAADFFDRNLTGAAYVSAIERAAKPLEYFIYSDYSK